jgi:hypothetical protein
VLVDLAGLVAADDPRLADLADAQPLVLGAYAIPVEGDPA